MAFFDNAESKQKKWEKRATLRPAPNGLRGKVSSKSQLVPNFLTLVTPFNEENISSTKGRLSDLLIFISTPYFQRPGHIVNVTLNMSHNASMNDDFLNKYNLYFLMLSYAIR